MLEAMSVSKRVSAGRPRGAAAVVAVCVLILGILGLHIPYIALAPGPAENVTSLISIEGAKTHPVRGKLMLTTVSLLSSIRIGEVFRGMFDPAVAIVSRSVIVPAGQSDQDVQQETIDQMRESQVFAAAAALQMLGYHVDIKYSGVRIRGVAPGVPASVVLRPGDTILDANGRQVRKPADLISAVRAHPVGSPITLHIVRGEKKLTFTVRTVGRPQNQRDPVIGVIIDQVPQVKLPLAIRIDAQGIGGPSAGLMFALGIVDALDNTDLTKGRTIAGTGEIALDGTVMPVGGVRQKVESARRAGAVLFIVPFDELRDACSVRKSMRVVGVRNLSEAVHTLQGRRDGAGRYCP
jgi:PDZ domain-containing protein